MMRRFARGEPDALLREGSLALQATWAAGTRNRPVWRERRRGGVSGAWWRRV